MTVIGSALRQRVEVAAEVDGDVADVDAEQVVGLVLEHESREERRRVMLRHRVVLLVTPLDRCCSAVRRPS